MSTTPFISTANTANNEPATAASSTAATGRSDQIRAPSKHNTNGGPITTATTSQCWAGARSWPPIGCPTAMTTANATVSTTAHSHSARVTGWRVNPRVDR